MKNFRHYLSISTLLVLIIFSKGLILVPTSSALSIQKQEDVNLDTTIIRADLSYSIPEQIIIAPIFIQGDSSNLTSTAKFRGLYYYLVQKLGFSDLPFHYVVSEDGEIFEGNIGGDERKVLVDGIGTNIILIGYLGGTLTSSFDPRSSNALSELLLELSNRNSINPNKTIVTDLSFVRDSESRSVVMKAKASEQSWINSLNDIKNKYADQYSPTLKTYSATAQIVGVLTNEVEVGSENVISIKLKNVGKNGIYGNSSSELVLSKADGSTSQFFLNNEWVSKSQVSLMVEGQNLLPGQEDIYEFKVKAPLYYGEVTELFELKTLNGAKIESETISLSLKMKRGEKKIVQINDTELGYLRVRSEPSTLGSEIGKLSSGEKVFILEDAGNGYYKVEMSDGTKGWIAGWLTTLI